MDKAVIFDIDGTLLDTTKGIRSSVNYVTKKFNLKQLTDSEFKDFLSYSPITASFSNVCKTDEKMSQICGGEFVSVYKQKFLHLAQVYDGIVDLLNYLKGNHYKLGVATYKNESNARLLLSHLGIDKYFNEIFGSNEDKNRTKRDILSDCIKQLGSNNEKCLFIGDSKTDATSANELNIPFIGVTYGFGFKTKDDVKPYSPVFIADNPAQIIDFLN